MGDLAEKYEADSSGEILVLLDTTPDQTMLEEGVAREVINRVQKLRKSAGLKVADKVTMLYTVTPEDHSLNRIIKEHLDYIQTSSITCPIKFLVKRGVRVEGSQADPDSDKRFPLRLQRWQFRICSLTPLV